jgi:hypothetical protein
VVGLAAVGLIAAGCTAEDTTSGWHPETQSASATTSPGAASAPQGAFDPATATCADFLAIPAEARLAWALDGVGDATESTIEGLAVVCAIVPGDLFATTAQRYGARIAGASNVVVAWSTTSTNGYIFDSHLELGLVEGGPAVNHPAIPDFVPGQTCTYDPAVDAIVPVTLRITNASTSDATPFSAFTVTAEGTETVTVEIEGLFTPGAECMVPEAGSGEVRASVEYLSPREPGSTIANGYFIILKNYFSPAYPEGNSADLARIEVTGVEYFTTDGSDPVVSVSTERWSLAGVRVS